MHLHQAPADYHRLLALDAKQSVTWHDEPVRGIQLVHAFTPNLAELTKLLTLYRKRLAPDGAV